MKLLLFGPPGVGKGTIGKLLENAYSLPLISAGDLVRAEIKKNTDFGKKAVEYTKAGELIPDEEVTAFIIPILKKGDYKDGFILDGYPRTIAQAEACDKADIEFIAAIDLEAPEEVLIQRLSDRRTCRACGALFNVVTKPPKVEGVCDACDGELYQRDDQRPEVIKERLVEYNEKTKPLTDYYLKKKKLLKVSAEGTPDIILQNILVLLKDVYP